MKKKIFLLFGLFTIAALTFGFFCLDPLLSVMTGYHAKYLCSSVFISGRDPGAIEALDLGFAPIRYVRGKIDSQHRVVVSRLLWKSARAVWRDRFGCTLMTEPGMTRFLQVKFPMVMPRLADPDTVPWPAGNVMTHSVTGIDTIRLSGISHGLMNDRKYGGTPFAFMVVHRGVPVMESYREGIGPATRLPSWSMAKSFTNAFAGAMVMKGLLDTGERAAVAEWANDGRRDITLNHLMRMQSGLRWNEDYGNHSDVTRMLYEHGDCAEFSLRMPQEHPAGTSWYYSSGSANIFSYLLRKHFRNDADYYSFPFREVFYRTGMRDVVFETDQAGNFVGSSYIFATARDYARFGLLYLRDGVFNGERILPEGWVRYSVTPASHSNGNYGALFWLNRGKLLPSAPADMFFCNGYNGQRIFIIPSADMVVVVLGHSHRPENDMDFNLLLKDILDTLPEKEGPGHSRG